MKEQKWDDSLESTKEFLDPGAIALEEVDGEGVERLEDVREAASKPKTQFTELRRRIEERLDSKRIDLEFEFDEMEESGKQTENLQ
jgi:hypothetical protein